MVLPAMPPLPCMPRLFCESPSQGIKMHEGSTNLRLMQELHSATDLALRHLWSKSTIYVSAWLSRRSRQSMLSQCSRLPGWTVRRHCRGLCPAVLGSTEADRGIFCPRCDAPSATAPPQGKPQSAHRHGCPPLSSRAAPPCAESSPRPACRASRRRAAPPPPPVF